MKKANVFLIHTEYHLMLAINLVFTSFKDRKNYIYITKGRITREFVSDKDFLEYRYLPAHDYGTKSFVKDLLKLDMDHFFYFQEDWGDNVYITYYLYKNKIPVSLLEDGTKPYHCYHKKHLFLSRVRDTLIIYRDMMRRKSIMPTLFLSNYYSYANTKYVTDIWLRFPESYPLKTTKCLVKIPEFNAECIDYLFKIYGFSNSIINTNAILYIGNPTRYDNERATELWFLNELRRKFPEHDILYKVHPNTSKDALEKIREIDGVSLFEERIPAELLILSMRNTIIVGACSTSMLTKNDTCNYYWTHKMFLNGKVFSTIQPGNPTDFIKEVHSIDEIVF